jgi:hypothetical protein
MFFFGAHTWRGETGRRYKFSCALTKRGIPDDSGGIYVFVRRRFAFFLKAIYVGKAANLRSRLLGHEKWGKAWWILGATERHVMRVGSEDERRMIEEDLIRGLKPRMNDVQMPRCEDDAPNTPVLREKWMWRRKVAAWFAGLFGGKPKAAHEGHHHDHAPTPHRRAHKPKPPNNGYWRDAA